MIDFRDRDRARLEKHARDAGFDRVPDELVRFAELVSRWGKKTDLVKAESVDELVDVLFTDAWQLAKLLDGLEPGPRRVLDVGAGAGAPTIPLVVLRPELSAVLLEPRRRRVAFMRTAVGALGLRERVDVEEGRLEAWDGDCDLASSRATFAPEEWLERASVLAPRVVVMLAGAEPPERDGWEVEAESSYHTIAGAPRRVRVYRLLRPSGAC